MWPSPFLRTLASLGLVLGLTSLGQAQPQLEVNQKTFRGELKLWGKANKQPTLWIELGSLAHYLGWARHPGYSGWCLGPAAEQKDCLVGQLLGPDKVYWEGKKLLTQRLDGKLYLCVDDLAGVLKWNVKRQGEKWAISLPEPTATSAKIPGAPAAGKEFSVKSDRATPGSHKLLLFYTQWCPSCWKYFPILEALQRSHPEIELVECDIDDFGSPMCEQYGVRATPWLRLYDDQGQVTADGNAAEDWLEKNYGVAMPTQLKCVGAPKR